VFKGQVVEFIRRKSFMIFACLAAACLGAAAQTGGVDKPPIVLGQSVALTGPNAPMAAPFARGARLYFARLNLAGGVDGQRVELVTVDDAGEPSRTLANTQRFLDEGVLALFGYYGSPQVIGAYPTIKASDAILFGPMASADELRGPVYANVYSMRPGFSEEAAAVTRHVDMLGARRLVILHGPDSESLFALDSAQRTTTAMGANLLASLPLEQVGSALEKKPQAVLVLGDATSAGKGIRALRAQGFRGPIYGFSNTGEGLLAEQLGAAGSGVVVVRVTPKPDHARTALVRELMADAAAARLKPDVYLLEGYLAARALTEALRVAVRKPPLNAAGLREAIEGLSNLDVGGVRVHFDGERVGSRRVDLSLIDGQGRVRE
jgi:branched-chain amino acid transport system substrate-binding protein